MFETRPHEQSTTSHPMHANCENINFFPKRFADISVKGINKQLHNR